MRITTNDILLFSAYTVVSVPGLVIMRWWLPQARIAWDSNHDLMVPLFMVCLGAFLYIVSFLTGY